MATTTTSAFWRLRGRSRSEADEADTILWQDGVGLAVAQLVDGWRAVASGQRLGHLRRDALQPLTLAALCGCGWQGEEWRGLGRQARREVT